MIRTLALFSGGLDSVLAAKLILEQGIEVIGVNFITPFFASDNEQKVKQIAANLGIELKTIGLGDEYVEIVKSPKYGYGKNLNPCLDCRILMLKRAKGLLQRKRLSFIITGEVLGQRPMSQHKNAFALIEKESNLKGLILRPLSAKLLPLTLAEKENWVDREKLLDIQGRSRRIQIDLANKWGISNYFSPSGGCLLTDPIFSQRMRDLLRYQDTSLDNIELLKIGRHFRLSPRTKLIVGRDERENNFLVELIKTEDVCFRPIEVKGPIGIGKGNFDDSLIGLATQIIARYCDEKEKAVEIGWKLSNQKMKKIKVMAMSEKEIEEFRI
ncbi:MAG: tRNA 4-thiouridine(8) synthase ThiI [Candidatus Omnitrophica bacterium]|nr:tRNA 4-thiouridine(8) synthase ThiI [Candidatus Omnitrophota bacterium]